VRLACTPSGLAIELIGVAPFSLGFAPAGVADPVRLLVPYTAVRSLVREGRLLRLALDPAVATPYNRFALARFTDEPDEVLGPAQTARARARWAGWLLPWPVGALAAWLAPADLAGGALGRASFGVVAALALRLVLREVAAWITWGGPASDRVRDAFEAALAERLTAGARAPVPPPALGVREPLRAGHRPGLRSARPSSAPDPGPTPFLGPAVPATQVIARGSARTSRALPRTPAAGGPAMGLGRPLAAALAAAVFVVLVLVFLRRVATEAAAPLPPTPPLVAGLGAAVRAVRGPDDRATPRPERCLCMRADSPLWKDGVPQLAVITFAGDDGPPVPPEPHAGRAPGYDFDVAVVNDGARALHDIRLTLTFARRTAAGRRVGAVDRGLFWGGALAPGHAVKWHVAAPGNEVRFDVGVSGTLAEAHVDPAPADAFFGLLSSRVRAVRVHGAMMLAYLRDPRAESAARSLSALSPAEEALLARIRRAAAPVAACDVVRREGRLDACIFNGASLPKSGLALREVGAAAGAPPRTFPVEATVPVHEGIRVAIPVEGDPPEEIEVVEAAEAPRAP
jgi:hypothetical protein